MVENVYSKEQEKRLKTSKILLFWSRFSMPLCKNLPNVYAKTWHFIPNATVGQCQNINL